MYLLLLFFAGRIGDELISLTVSSSLTNSSFGMLFGGLLACISGNVSLKIEVLKIADINGDSCRSPRNRACVNPVRPGREQRQQVFDVPGCGWQELLPS